MRNFVTLLLLSLSLGPAAHAAAQSPLVHKSDSKEPRPELRLSAQATLKDSRPALCMRVKEKKDQSSVLDDANWKLIFDCEFDSADDMQKWNKQDQTGERYNNELQAYVVDAFQVNDGCLYIEAQKRDAAYSGELMHYTSGRLNTKDKFDIQYGRFEIRLKVPRGRGFWPAFWLLPASGAWPPEIDFLELLGHQPERMYFTNHWQPHEKGRHPQYGTHFDARPDFSQEFHVVTGVWNDREIQY